MIKKRAKNGIISKLVSRQDLNKNLKALKIYDVYKKTEDIIERVDMATGKGMTLKSNTGSTLNFEINKYGAYSTTQKI